MAKLLTIGIGFSVSKVRGEGIRNERSTDALYFVGSRVTKPKGKGPNVQNRGFIISFKSIEKALVCL